MTNVKLILLFYILCWSYTVDEIICKPLLVNRENRQVNNNEKMYVNQEMVNKKIYILLK